MTWQTIVLDANAIICALIVVRLMFFSKSGKRHRPGVTLMAYLMILAAGFTAFRILYGKYLQVDPGELMLNVAICVAVWRSRGNLAKVFQKAGQ
ncbi:phage holin family protein [Leclercia sp.]|uniref:phage holin family protein n=1 Tax=Leclercia sp. TaxID=1898428 RepID=UPI0021BF2F31|nr:phage holin family protein [Leclercia sp.]ELK1314685.1 phage holin family protein [Escherichia coli]MCT9843720.1 phage holin family protein [Leclercia adecarboxylata ATCC 23216 = NBRC 102595]